MNGENNHPPPLTGCEPLCGWTWYRHSQRTFTQAMFNQLGLEVSINGRSLPTVHTGNDKSKRKEIMQVVKSYRKG